MSNETPIPAAKPAFSYSEAKQKDLELYLQWKNEGSKQALGKLIGQLSPVIYSEVRRVSGTLPEAALSSEAKKWAIRAIQTYDPDKGVALSTHVTNYLPKVRRLNYKYQNSARLPENLHLQFTEFKNAVSHLENTLNREPKDEELAKHLGWSKPQVVKYKGSLYEDLTEGGTQRANEVSHFNSDSFLLSHIMDSLDEQEKLIFTLKGTMPANELAEKLGVNVSRLNYLQAKLIAKIASMKKEIGLY
jgi:DNA-directed RNA polymerase specialized sigma subunit